MCENEFLEYHPLQLVGIADLTSRDLYCTESLISAELHRKRQYHWFQPCLSALQWTEGHLAGFTKHKYVQSAKTSIALLA